VAGFENGFLVSLVSRSKQGVHSHILRSNGSKPRLVTEGAELYPGHGALGRRLRRRKGHRAKSKEQKKVRCEEIVEGPKSKVEGLRSKVEKM
jgi:hypothetical protein